MSALRTASILTRKGPAPCSVGGPRLPCDIIAIEPHALHTSSQHAPLSLVSYMGNPLLCGTYPRTIRIVRLQAGMVIRAGFPEFSIRFVVTAAQHHRVVAVH